MNSRNSNFFLGLFTFALLINLMLIEKNEQSSNYLKLFASFNKIDGVKIGTNILVSGVEIGSVEKINLESNFPTLTMKIRNDIKISDDSSISIQTDGLFGNKFLSVEVGGSEKYMKDGDKFSYSEDSILIEELLRKIINIGEKNKKS